MLTATSGGQPRDFRSSTPSSDFGSTQFPVLNLILLELPRVVPVSCTEPGLIHRRSETPGFGE